MIRRNHRYVSIKACIQSQTWKRYEDAGQRSPVRVFWSGGTVPGPANTVYMEWVQEKLESPYREENSSPDTGDLRAQLSEVIEDQHIEFYEMYQSH